MGQEPATPLLSFGASGAIGSAVVYSSYKKCSYTRKYVKPKPSTTPEALKAKQDLEKSIWSWKNIFNGVIWRECWKRFDNFMEYPDPDFIRFNNIATEIRNKDPKASFAHTYTPTEHTLKIDFLDVTEGHKSEETGSFEIWTRWKGGAWKLKERQELINGHLLIDITEERKKSPEIKIIKDKINRSGTYRIPPL